MLLIHIVAIKIVAEFFSLRKSLTLIDTFISFQLFLSVILRKTWMTLWSMSTKSLAIFVTILTIRAFESTTIHTVQRFLFWLFLHFFLEFTFAISSLDFYLRVFEFLSKISYGALRKILIRKLLHFCLVERGKLITCTFTWTVYFIRIQQVLIFFRINVSAKICLILFWLANSSIDWNCFKNISLVNF